ncbi:uncharacterized protein LOC125374743 [Haliotis rufescens]|uniref:uncharacterized protein LOC125374743 n=1 Tax=Haliotis rufescens TaxID=6454 RepID=UPI00201F38CD|nr:uncharacterized protein LOC125374743 [Haliotis rufescens]
MYFVLRKSKTFNLSIKCQLYLFDAMVDPILLYGCEIWGFENCKQIESVHLNFPRKLLPIRKSTHLYMLYGELGRVPLSNSIKCRMVCFGAKVLSGKEQKLSRILYQMLYIEVCTNNSCKKWIKCLESIFNETGFSFYWLTWLSQQAIPPNALKSIMSLTLSDIATHTWNAEITHSSKGITYRIFKTELVLEKYKLVIPFSLAVKFLLFGTSCHHLPIELGRWHNIPVKERTCKLCDMSDVGDEFHFIFVCPYFKPQRKLYVPISYAKNPNILKFKELFNCKKINVIKKLCTFCNVIMKTVKSSM